MLNGHSTMVNITVELLTDHTLYLKVTTYVSYRSISFYHKSSIFIGYCRSYYISAVSINQLVDYYKCCLLIDWATHCLLMIDHLYSAKGINFQIQNNVRKRTFCQGFSLILWNNILSNYIPCGPKKSTPLWFSIT